MESSVTSALRKRLSPLGELGRSLYSMRRMHLIRFDLSQPLPEIRPRVPMTFREATSEEMERFSSDPAHEVSPATARKQRRLLESGCRCVIGLSGDRIVYHSWTTTRIWKISGSRALRLGKGKAMLFSSFTVADMRRKGIYAAGLAAELHLLKGLGASMAFGNVADYNLASLKAVQQLGFVSLGLYRIVHTAGLVSVWMDPSMRRMMETDS